MFAYCPLHRTHALEFSVFFLSCSTSNNTLNHLPTYQSCWHQPPQVMEISLVTVLLCMLSLDMWQFQFWGSPDLAGVNQQPPMHQLRMRPFNPFCGWTSSLPVEIFFFTSSLPRNSLPPPSYLPPPTYHLPTPPPLTPSLELQKPWVAVERELERDPRAHENVRCLRFFFFLFEECLRNLLLPLSLLHYSFTGAQQRRRPSSSFCSKRRRPSSFSFFAAL